MKGWRRTNAGAWSDVLLLFVAIREPMNDNTFVTVGRAMRVSGCAALAGTVRRVGSYCKITRIYLCTSTRTHYSTDYSLHAHGDGSVAEIPPSAPCPL